MSDNNDKWLGIRGVPWGVAVFLNLCIIGLLAYGVVAMFTHSTNYPKYSITYSFQDEVSGTKFNIAGVDCISAHKSYSDTDIIKRFLRDKKTPTSQFTENGIVLKKGCSGASPREKYKEKEKEKEQ